MKRFSLFLLLGLAAATVVASMAATAAPDFSTAAKKLLSSIFFVESTTTAELQRSYASGRRIRVLIVPGHDNDAWGTEFRGVKEADMTVALGEELNALLSSDPHYEPILVRSRAGYAKEFADYFVSETPAVKAFVANKKKVMQDLVRQGLVERVDNVIHNNAPTGVAWKLYGINKWASEHVIDLVIHIHFNDYPGRRYDRPGEYTGFAVYVPDTQYSNAGPSRLLASALALKLSASASPSDHPQEGAIVPDQELIALGSYNTLDPAAVLIEYGYIYERRFNPANLPQTLNTLAQETYEGLNSFFRE